MSTSTRSISCAGIWFKSAELAKPPGPVTPPAPPGFMRRLLISTRVRWEPRSRTLTVLMPMVLMELPEGDSVLMEGKFCRTSSVRTSPVCWMSTAVTVVMGLMEMSFGACSSREPVTTTSSTGAGAAAGAACA